MKKRIILGVLSILLTSCAPKAVEKITETNTKEYQLVWSDEFDGTTINTSNWSYQVEPAGRFNNEWQAYTNSSENAYIENGNLVIEAKHTGGGIETR